MSFNNCTVYCPKCPPRKVAKSHPDSPPELECTVENYSGCGVDFGECPECGKRFQVSYKVDEITELKN